ncbi:MAG: porin [Bradyrhizobium sp.]|nr:MAG: porin [Bradyrhizobium sp.]
MTLIKSLLLGSSATLIAVAGAQAADLPTKKGAPAAEYVKVCKIGGVAGFIIPGSDTCLKISGGARFMIDAGNVGTQWKQNFDNTPASSAAKYRNSFGISARADLGLDAASNTAYGLLTAHIDLHWDQGSGLELAGDIPPNGAGSYINQAYLQWAGLTAGIKPSYFDYIGGGETWNNIISPDHTGTGVPLIAYTASFGGGFAATIAAEQNAGSGGVSYVNGMPGSTGPDFTALGIQAPDIVAALDLTQGWGSAHLAGVLHNVRLEGHSGTTSADDIDQWGYAITGGVGFNLPSLGAGDLFKVQGTYTHEAINYSGFNSEGWGTGFNLNGNGLIYQFADAYEGGGRQWTVPSTWGIAAIAELHLTPQFAIDPEISYGTISWGSHAFPFRALEGDGYSWAGGAAFHWDPVTNLDFNLDLFYTYGNSNASTFTGATPAASESGFNVRFGVERDF